MATQQSPKSSTPVRVPKSAATYTHATEDPSLRSQINTVLLRDGHISRIQDQLLHTLHHSPTSWPSLIQAHALSLLRSGEVSTFPALMARVLADVAADTETQRERRIREAGAGAGGGTGVNGVGKDKKDKGKSAFGSGSGTAKDKGGEGGKGEGGTSLALPRNVLDEGIRVVKEGLAAVCEVER